MQTRIICAQRGRRYLAIVAVFFFAQTEPVAVAADVNDFEEIVVTSQRREQPRLLHMGNIDRLGNETLDAIKRQHVQELFTRVASVWKMVFLFGRPAPVT